MTSLMARSLNIVVIIVFIYAAALSAAAQGQTPTTPAARPAPSSAAARTWEGTQRRAGSSLGSEDGANQEGTRPNRIDRSKEGKADAKEGKEDAPKEEGKGLAERASGDAGPGKEPPAARGEGGAKPRMVGGGDKGKAAGAAGAAGATPPGAAAPSPGGTAAAGGTGAAFQKGTVTSVSISGEGAFEPILQREPEYGTVPEDGEKITLEGPMPLEEFLSAINLATNWNMVVSPGMEETQLRFWLFDVTPKQALEVLKFNKVYYEFDEASKFLRVMTKEEYLEREFGKSKPHEFTVTHADVTYIESLINSLLSPTGRAITDQRTNNIYVWDTEDNIKEMVRIVAEVDVPLQKAEFTIEHAELADIETALTNLLSQSGKVLSDVRTSQIFVWDNPTVLDQIRETVAQLDTPVESKTFYITHVNAEDVLDSIEAMLSERGTIQMDPRYNTLVVTELPSRMEKIGQVIETLDQALETRTWVLKYAEPDDIADQVEAYIPGEMGQIVVQEDVHQITVTGLPSRLDEIDALIKVWDVKRKQVLIEAYVVEVSAEIERAFNVNWSYFANVGGAPFALHSGSGSDSLAEASGSGQVASGGRSPYAVPRYGALEVDESGHISRPILEDITGAPVIDSYRGGNLAATLDYLDSQQKATILSSPKVAVQDGEEAIFENATKVPYVSASGGYGYGGYGYGYGGYGGNTGTNTDNSEYYRRMSAAGSRVEFIDVGTILSVLPRVTEDQNILLDISAEDSTFTDKKIVVDDLSRTVPEKTLRRADTQVRVNSGDTIVLGGLRRDRTSNSSTRTPLLGDLPLIGKLFQNPKKSAKNSTLLIFMTTTIVGEDTMPEAVEITRADSEIADANRQMKKSLLDRMKNKLSEGKNEIGVSIGQGGQIHCAGEMVTLEQLGEKFFDAPKNMPVTVVVRKHPAAPIDTVNEVTEVAMEAGLRIEFDTESPPIVPSIPKEKEPGSE